MMGTMRRRVAALIAALLLVAGGSACADDEVGSESATARQTSEATLLVDDAAAANPDLVETGLIVPAGLSAEARTLRLPPGFSIELLATGLSRPRFMAFDEAGNLLVAAAGSGNVYRYPAGADGRVAPAASPPQPLLSGLDAPTSVALHTTADGTYLYIGETRRVSRVRYSPSGPAGDVEVVIPNLPAGGHNTRTVAFGPDGTLYLAVGSSCNICDESDERRAAVLRYDADGSDYERFAWGLRNPVGLAFEPGTDILWATVNERDNQGNEIPPDLVTRVQEGANYGWPDCRPPDATPQDAGADCGGITPPTVGIQAHSAPLGLAFYSGAAVPEAYRDSIIVVQHGSWNRQPPAAPKLLQIAMTDGRPSAVRDFATGWQLPDNRRWGRPAGVVVAPDGSLVVSDDQAGALYRISPGR